MLYSRARTPLFNLGALRYTLPLVCRSDNHSVTYTTGQNPQEWKLSNVSPIYKKDDRHIGANYRPIALTCLFQAVRIIVVSHLSTHTDTYSIFTPLKLGFRKKHSTVSQLILILCLTWLNVMTTTNKFILGH